MDKDWMLEMVRTRINELRILYRAYCDMKSPDGTRELTYQGAATLRSRVKKDLGTLQLLEQLLMHCSDFVMDDADCVSAFDRLVEPRR